MKSPFISIVSPVYKAENIIPLLVSEVKKEIVKITDNYEIILVEDGSSDKSWEAILSEAKKDKKIKAIKLSRNFGQHYAITAGTDHALGEWVVVMDCDLQDKPSEIKKLFDKASEGFDIVLARRALRKDNFHKRFFSKSFYKVLSYLTGTKQDPAIANFGIYHSKAISAIKTMREPIRYFPTMINWVGFSKTSINVEHANREIGKTSYNYRRLFRLAKDIVIANSDKPIYAFAALGFLISIVSFIFGAINVFQYFSGKIKVPGYTSLIISIWFLGGIIIMILGVIGIYLGKTFEAVKNRPIYIIDKIVNDGRD